MSERPDWVVCIRDPAKTQPLTLCGRLEPTGFQFGSVDHWFNNSRAESRLVGCPKCIGVVGGALARDHNINAEWMEPKVNTNIPDDYRARVEAMEAERKKS